MPQEEAREREFDHTYVHPIAGGNRDINGSPVVIPYLVIIVTFTPT